jgi:carbonic anhydrase/acetyltransferase-like protein (isoleucine patch superfamily)
MKYEFTGEVKVKYGITLKRIRRLSDGEIGGWIESEKNLNKVSGDAWVSGNAKVFGDAEVSGNAKVSGDAWVSGNAKVFGDAWVSGNA